MMNTRWLRAFIDARIQRIYGGTNEIMKEIIQSRPAVPALIYFFTVLNWCPTA